MSISEIAFRFSLVLNTLKDKTNGAKIANLQRYVRDEMFYCIKNKIPSQEFYSDTKKYIEDELNGGGYAA